MQVDPDDRLIHEDVDFDVGPGEILDEKEEFTIRNMTGRQQKEANKIWLKRRGILATDMWVDIVLGTAEGMRWR